MQNNLSHKPNLALIISLSNYRKHCLFIFRYTDTSMQLIKSIYSMEEINLLLEAK